MLVEPFNIFNFNSKFTIYLYYFMLALSEIDYN